MVDLSKSKVISIELENFMGVTSAFIEFKNPLTIIEGKNGSGKTSVLDAWQAALGGKKFAPEKPIKDGESKSQVLVRTPDFVVRRRWTDKGSTIKIQNPDGSKSKLTPTELYQKFVGSLSFDPMKFLESSKLDRAETLRNLVGIDFTEHDRLRHELYALRTAANAECKSAEARLNGLDAPEKSAPRDEVSARELFELRDRQSKDNDKNSSKKSLLGEKRREAAVMIREAADTETKLEELNSRIGSLKAEGTRLAADVSELIDHDLSVIDEKIQGIEESNAKAREANAYDVALVDQKNAAEDARELNRRMDAIDKEKSLAIAGADYPVDGLTADEDDVYFDGIPFDQVNTAKQIEVSTAIGLSLDEGTKVLLIRRGSELDGDTLRSIAKMAADAGAYILMERVTPGATDEATVVIKDGSTEG